MKRLLIIKLETQAAKKELRFEEEVSERGANRHFIDV